MLGGIDRLQSAFGSDIDSVTKGMVEFAGQLQENRRRDQKVLGKALGNIAAGLGLMSSAVMETRMVFPGTERDTMTPQLDATYARSSDVPTMHEKEHPDQPPSASPTLDAPGSGPAPARVTMSNHVPASSPSDVFSALKRAGQQGPLMFDDGDEVLTNHSKGSTVAGGTANSAPEFLM